MLNLFNPHVKYSIGVEVLEFTMDQNEVNYKLDMPLIESTILPKKVTPRVSKPNLIEPVPRPFVKWAGGKRQLLDILNAAKPSSFGRYFEPFIGGGAFLFSQLPDRATISDANPELINCYQVIKNDVDALIRSLIRHKNDEIHFYETRAKDPSKLTAVQRASRFIFLNKTCFNGLYRENKSGQFNTPFGRYENPKIADKANLEAISAYLNTSDVAIHYSGYQTSLDKAEAGDFVYLDPPYVPLTKTASFASYLKGGFGLEDQAALAKSFAELSHRGVLVMLSNSNTEVIHELYKGFNIKTIHATRAINCKGGSRGKEANEVLVTNY
jgi:DNA adenine methylase